MLPPESTWAHAARLFYAWDSNRKVWNFIGQFDDKLVYPNIYNSYVFDTTGNVHSDIRLYLLNVGRKYDTLWVGEVMWIWVNPPNPQAGWHLFSNHRVDAPQCPQGQYIDWVWTSESEGYWVCKT